MDVDSASEAKRKLLTSGAIAGATFIVTALTWSLLTTGTLRAFAPVFGFVMGMACSFAYRRRVGVKLGSVRDSKE